MKYNQIAWILENRDEEKNLHFKSINLFDVELM